MLLFIRRDIVPLLVSDLEGIYSDITALKFKPLVFAFTVHDPLALVKLHSWKSFCKSSLEQILLPSESLLTYTSAFWGVAVFSGVMFKKKTNSACSVPLVYFMHPLLIVDGY